MAPVRPDAPPRSGQIQSGVVPSALTPQPFQAAAQGLRPTYAPVAHDTFDSAAAPALPPATTEARNPRSGAAADAPVDAFVATPPAQAVPAPTTPETPAEAPLPDKPELSAKQQRAYDSLPPEQQARFDQLMSTAQALPSGAHAAMEQVHLLLGREGGFKHFYLIDQAIQGKSGDRAEAPAALERLLFNGRLTEGGSRLDQNALEHLGVLASMKGLTDMGCNAHNLLADIVLDLAYPGRIEQGLNNLDCGGTAAAVILATENPAEYARIVTELGTEGQTTIGEKVWTATSFKETREEDGPTRSLSQRLFAATYVDQTNNPNVQTTSDEAVGELVQEGEFGREMAKGLSTLTGRDYKAAHIPSAGESDVVTHRAAIDEAITAIFQHLNQKAPVAINLGNHWVVATRLYTSGDGEPLLRVVDGSGKSHALSIRRLTHELKGFVFDEAISSVPDWMRKAKYDDPGGGGNGNLGQPVED